ncbi:transmembrane protein 141 [Alligator sinensis]|uniref:Transmembrane protein 141 n=1 Tax=Alligator sinensis TaxID=38654 RepID=A0A1U8D0Y6_ALLSI|nr:transmembrane protein 141 [Alligator sinensis]
MISKRWPYALQWKVLLSVVAGSIAGYAVTKAETQKCSNLWIYLETGQFPQGETREKLPSPEPTEDAKSRVKRNKYGDEVE